MGRFDVTGEQINNGETTVRDQLEILIEQEQARKTGWSATRSTFVTAPEGLGPIRSTGINNTFNYPPDTAAPVPRDTEESDPLAWRKDALCAQTDPEAFFPEKGGSTRDAKKVCTNCDVKEDCLIYALDHDERFGIWGGLSERERRKLKRRAS